MISMMILHDDFCDYIRDDFHDDSCNDFQMILMMVLRLILIVISMA